MNEIYRKYSCTAVFPILVLYVDYMFPISVSGRFPTFIRISVVFPESLSVVGIGPVKDSKQLGC